MSPLEKEPTQMESPVAEQSVRCNAIPSVLANFLFCVSSEKDKG